MPDYSASDDYHVELSLSAIIKNKALALFIESEQSQLSEDQKLSVLEMLALYSILEGDEKKISKNTLHSLLAKGLIEKRGKTRGVYHVLSRIYYELADDAASYSKKSEWNISQVASVVIPHLQQFKKAKMKDFVELFSGHLTRRQVRVLITQMVKRKILKQEGVGSGATYSISDSYEKDALLMVKALGVGIEELIKRSEL